MRRALAGLLLAALATPALAQDARAPRRAIPPSVLAELAVLENRFDAALAADCDAEQCFSKGCTYVAHAVADRPPSASLPGLGLDPGPGSVEAQAWLTQARCSFAHEDGIEAEDVAALARRLQSKVSTGWTVVTVGSQALQPLPAYLQEPPAPEAPAAEAPPPAPPPAPEWSLATASRELWTALLDDFYWMIALVLGTLAATTLIWAWRRVGRESFEERALLAQLERGDAEEPAAAEAPVPPKDDGFVASQAAAWRLRLGEMDPEFPDPEVQAMLRELLRAGELPLLAKAVLTFPETLPAAFPTGGDIAAAKLALSEYLKTVDLEALPSDADLYRALNRHALSAALASQRDAEIVRSLREEFGAAGLVGLIADVPARAGALLFALAPVEAQYEVVRLLAPRRAAALAEQLLRSNRMDEGETAFLFEVLEAARAGKPLPAVLAADEVSDHGATFDASSALSVLLPRLDPAARAALFAGALQRFGGSLPAWYRDLFLPEMLFELPDEARADLLLEIDVDALAGWMSLLEPDVHGRVLGAVPASLRAPLRAASVFPSRAEQLALADRGRRALARAYQGQLARAHLGFEQVVATLAAGRS